MTHDSPQAQTLSWESTGLGHIGVMPVLTMPNSAGLTLKETCPGPASFKRKVSQQSPATRKFPMGGRGELP